MSNAVLTFVIVGHDDHPIFETDLAPKLDGREVNIYFLNTIGQLIRFARQYSFLRLQLQLCFVLTDPGRVPAPVCFARCTGCSQ